VAVFVAIVSTFVVQMHGIADDPGLGWHLKAGEYILENGALPKTDPFLAFPVARPWLLDQWFSDVLMASVFQKFGWPGLYNLGAAVYLLTFLLIIHSGLSRLTKGAGLAACFGTFVAFKLGQVHFIVRPVIFSFPLFAAVFLRLCRMDAEFCRRGRFCVRKADWLFLPLLFLAWANVHPTFVVGLFLFPLAVGGWSLQCLLRGKRFPRIWQVTALGAVCGFATLLNPYGFSLHETILWLSNSKFCMNTYQEWQSPSLATVEGQYFMIPVALLAVLAFIAPRAMGSLSWFSAFSLAAFFYFGCSAIRMMPFWGIISGIVIGRVLPEVPARAWIRDLPVARLLFPAFERLSIREARSWRGKPLLLGMLVAVVITTYQGKPFLFGGDLGPSRKEFPYGALPQLRKAAETNQPVIVANHMAWASFINLYAPSLVKPIVDDRTRLLGDEFYAEFFAAMKIGGDWRGFFKRMGVTHVLLPSKDSFAQYLSQTCGLSVLYVDALSTLIRYDEAVLAC
jgi:hypothetical protein